MKCPLPSHLAENSAPTWAGREEGKVFLWGRKLKLAQIRVKVLFRFLLWMLAGPPARVALFLCVSGIRSWGKASLNEIKYSWKLFLRLVPPRNIRCRLTLWCRNFTTFAFWDANRKIFISTKLFTRSSLLIQEGDVIKCFRCCALLLTLRLIMQRPLCAHTTVEMQLAMFVLLFGWKNGNYKCQLEWIGLFMFAETFVVHNENSPADSSQLCWRNGLASHLMEDAALGLPDRR